MFNRKIKYIALIGSITGISIAAAAFFQFYGISWTAHILGSFFTDGTGNAGNVMFNQTAWLNGNKLTWTFWVETIGTVTFDANAEIHSPLSGKVTDLWSVSGTASSNAGPIDLSWVQYDPVLKILVWFGTNNGVWKVPFGVAGSIATSITGTTSTGFEWRVKVLGNIGWNSSFDTFYSAGTKFNTSIMNDTLNKIRKNVAILSRNISNSYMNSWFASSPTRLGNKIFFINKGTIPKTLRYSDISSDFPSASVDSVIVVGGDIIIDTDIINNSIPSKPKGIIVLKNDSGLGGNIIVNNNVKKIESSIFTEGTLYSGDDLANLYNDTALKINTLGENQLYIKWSLMSRNTIGWAIQTGSVAGNGICVYNQTSCTYEQAIRYDLNYFRITPPTRTIVTRSYNANYDNYAVIIEQDTRISSNPPPGFEIK